VIKRSLFRKNIERGRIFIAYLVRGKEGRRMQTRERKGRKLGWLFRVWEFIAYSIE